jgi:ketosteroid isomerase-like protein
MKSPPCAVLVTMFSGVLGCYAATAAYEGRGAQHERLIKDYFRGWEDKDWNAVRSQLAEGFTFTSPAPDDHIPTERFRAKCWNQAEHIQRFEFMRIAAGESDAFALVHVITKQGRIIRNVEHFRFDNGKIESIEVFFGGAGEGFPTNAR